jgi:hypothetical protein
MVKYGYLMLGCLNCDLKVEDNSQIDFDREWEDNIIAQGCSHWQIYVDRCTRNTFTPWGKPDEIRYRVRVICKACNAPGTVEDGATSMSNMSNNYKKECCGSSLAVHISTGPNRITDVMQNAKMVLSLGKALFF